MIPTAEEYFKGEIPKHESVSQFMTDGDIFYHAREFAKMHVKAALEAASERAVAKENPSDYGTGEIWVDKKSILKAYPETNIK